MAVDNRPTLSHNRSVEFYTWNVDKNSQLQGLRGVAFEQAVYLLEQGFLLDILEHPNLARYKGQRIFIVRIGDYAVLVPFVETETEIFLKTIIPSRKATKKYIGSENDE